MEQKKISNRDLMLPYGVPYFAYVGIAALGKDRIPDEIGYILKIIIVPILLYWAWKWYVPVTGPKKIMGSVSYGVIFGVLGLLIWCLLLAPFIEHSGEPWSVTGFILRLLAASLIVPVFEEMFIRGYILRAALQWDMNRKSLGARAALDKMMDEDTVEDVAPGAWTVMAVGISTLAFTIGHTTPEWPAAIAYSLLMSWLWIIRKDLLSCIVAHGVTNLTLALYVYYSGNWGFW
ncbi:MAG: CPBP family glutamic-type intramembrane protease [Desulfobacula sp.]|jgi:hypothetical protein